MPTPISPAPMDAHRPGLTDADAMYLRRFMRLAREAASREALPPRRQRKVQRPVFVCGSPRSGTTLLGKCLGRHPEAAVAEESYFLMDLFMLHAGHFWGLNRDAWAPLDAYVDEPLLVAAAGAYADAVFGALLRREDAFHFVDHTPWYGLLAPFLAALYPQARMVHIIRDGRAVVRSLTALARDGTVWAGRSIGERAQLWRDVVSQTRALGPAALAERYVEVRYEALCTAPEQTLRDVVRQIGWRWHPAVLEPLARPHSTPTRPAVALAEHGEAGRLRLRPQPAPNGWPADWDAADRHAFAQHTAPVMEALGYG